MWRRNMYILLIIVMLTAGCQPYLSPVGLTQPTSPLPTPPVGWREVGLPGKFTFFIPPDMQEEAVQGIDSEIGSYIGDGLNLRFDYGFYSGPTICSGQAECQEEWFDIDGMRTRVVTFRNGETSSEYNYFAGVHFADVKLQQKPSSQQMPVTLSVYAWCKGPKQQALAKQIFQTIDFVEP
jgi:hypothetical protein